MAVEPAASCSSRSDCSRRAAFFSTAPPATAKRLLVKALASQSNLNFISVKGPELLSKYVGESEQGVRELFARARHAAPCIIFLDEVDALAPKRGFDGRSPVTDRVVSQLLTELDGVEALRDVWVIAATNRLDMIDDALLRPGRLDFRLEVGRPDRAARAAILEVHLRKKPIDQQIDRAVLADLTEGMSAAEVRFVCRSRRDERDPPRLSDIAGELGRRRLAAHRTAGFR